MIDLYNFELPTCAICLESKELPINSIFCMDCESEKK